VQTQDVERRLVNVRLECQQWHRGRTSTCFFVSIFKPRLRMLKRGYFPFNKGFFKKLLQSEYSFC